MIADTKNQLPRSGWRADFETYVPYILQGTKDLTNQERVSTILVSEVRVPRAPQGPSR